MKCVVSAPVALLHAQTERSEGTFIRNCLWVTDASMCLFGSYSRPRTTASPSDGVEVLIDGVVD